MDTIPTLIIVIINIRILLKINILKSAYNNIYI